MKSLSTIITLSALFLILASVAIADDSDTNIALNQPATASGMYAPYEIPNALDGDESTYWNAGGYAGHWIEIDLGQDTIIGCMRMKTAQVPNGGTAHAITGRTEAGDTVSLWGYSGYTVNHQWLENFDINNPIAVRYVRVTTTTTPSWVAWSEIEIFEGAVVATEESTWSGVKALYRSN